MKKIFGSLFLFALLASVQIFAADSGAVTEGKQVWAGHKILLADAITDSTLTGATSVDSSMTHTLRMDPGGASRNVTLDTSTNYAGNRFKFINSADAAENLVIKNSGGTTIVTIGQNEAGEVFYVSGTTWVGYAYSNASSGFVAASGATTGATSQSQVFTNGVTADTFVGNTATAMTVTAKAGSSAIGNALTIAGGAGNGAFNGGAASLTGGASGAGATGTGGAASLVGGAAASTNGSGGAVVLTGGVATGNGTGGALTFTTGASAGAGGTAGSVTIDTGAAAGGTAGTMTIGGTNSGQINIGRSGQIVSFPGIVQRTSQRRCYGMNGAKVGATAGFVVNAASDISAATCPQNQTGSTLIVPIGNLKSGTIITGFGLCGQIESGGNTVTVNVDLRKSTAAAADFTDASVSTMTQISVTADTKIDSTQDKTGISATVAQDEVYYLKITVTTGATTDVDIRGVRLIVTEQ